MHSLRFSWIFILGIAILGCVPSPEEGVELPRLYDTVDFKENVSRLIGHGGKTVTDNNGTLASNIVWKDSSGVTRSLEEFRGDIVVINMWATWCGPCREELPDLQSVAETYAPDGVRMIGIAIDRLHEPFRLVVDFAADYDITYQLIVDSMATSYINYGGNGDIPWTYIIDRDGYIQYSIPGKITKEKLTEAIETIL